MKNITKKLIVILTALQILTITSISAKTKETRIALIIGNSHYSKNIGTLANPANDATDMATTLKKLDFKVISGTDLSRDEILDKLDAFESQLRSSNPDKTVGLFYYAGHGMEVAGENYLLPIDAKVKYQEDIAKRGINLTQVIKTMKYSNNRLNIVILDACRNNPLPKKPSSLGRSVKTGGWSEISDELAEGIFIGYGTSKGAEAADGNGRNGLFTKYLLANIQKPGLTIERVFKNTRIAVNTESKKRGVPQTPVANSQLLGDFYFIPPNPNQIASTQSTNRPTVIQTPIQTQTQITPIPQKSSGTVLSEDGKLMWMRCSLGQTWNPQTAHCDGKAKGYEYSQALKTAKSHSYAGFNDWRVPTIEELETLVYCSTSKKSLDKHGRLDGCTVDYTRPTIDKNKFPDTPSSFFWSASPNAGDSDYAWLVYFNYGYSASDYRRNYRNVRLVRFGQ